MNRKLARSLLSLTVAGALLGATGAVALADALPQAPVMDEVFALEHTPHLFFLDEHGAVHMASDPKALTGIDVDWFTRRDITLGQLRQFTPGEPILSLALVKIGDAVYLPQTPFGGGAPVLRLVKPADLAVIGITGETPAGSCWSSGLGRPATGCAPPTCRRTTSPWTASRRWARPCPRSRPRTRSPRPDALSSAPAPPGRPATQDALATCGAGAHNGGDGGRRGTAPPVPPFLPSGGCGEASPPQQPLPPRTPLGPDGLGGVCCMIGRWAGPARVRGAHRRAHRPARPAAAAPGGRGERP